MRIENIYLNHLNKIIYNHMLGLNIISHYTWGDIEIFYLNKGDIYSLAILPSGKLSEVVSHRQALKDSLACREVARAFAYDFPAYELESMVQYKICGDGYFPQHASGDSMRNSDSVQHLTYIGQETTEGQIVTSFCDRKRKLRIIHTLKAGKDYQYLVINTALTNESEQTIRLEYLQAFSLGLLSMFQPAAGDNQYRIHRYRSAWSAEGREDVHTVEELGLEASWQGAGVRSLRFGQRSSVPIKKFFPYIALEDTTNHVIWGAEIAAVGPWQMEVARFGDFLNISGGQIDREMGNWTKNLEAGQTFQGDEAVVSCVSGTKAELNARLSCYCVEPEIAQPECDSDCPVMINEWCTTWGNPTAETLLPIAQKWSGGAIDYFILDDGWFRSESAPGYQLGDWVESADKYPHGLKAFCGQLRQLGYVPGIWFEFENAGQDSQIVKDHPDWFLHLDGEILKVGDRRFLDFRLKAVWNYLDEHLINMLRHNDIGYLKIDYNANIPIGVDGTDSKAENFRQHMEGVKNYLIHLRQSLPGLVVEICASGGHRLSPFWLRLGALGSATDAHEGVEIPLIAAHLSQIIPLRKSQIWAVIRPDDDDKRLHYSLAAAFMGRLCLSGNLANLSIDQENTIRQALEFYDYIKPLITSGACGLRVTCNGAWNNPQGYQIFTCENLDRKLIVVHTFSGAPKELDIETAGKGWQLANVFGSCDVVVKSDSDMIHVQGLAEFDGVAVLLEYKG